MICDFHLHTEFSGDSEAPVRGQIEQAIRLGMKEMCITDHHDYDSDFSGIDFNLDVPSYLETLNELKEEYRDQIRLNIGLELGLQKHIEDYLKDFVAKYGSCFDFIIGPSHYVDRMDPYDASFWQRTTTDKALERFFNVSLERIRSLWSCFDVYGHLDYVIRYAPCPHRFYDYNRYAPIIDEMLKCLIEHGKGIECNSGGLAYGLPEPNPCRQVLSRYRELGGEILTIGSDAHQPSRLGFDFERCRQILLECGFTHYTVFHDRKPEFLPL